MIKCSRQGKSRTKPKKKGKSPVIFRQLRFVNYLSPFIYRPYDNHTISRTFKYVHRTITPELADQI